MQCTDDLQQGGQLSDALEWLAAMCSHVPNRGEQMVRYYGYYSNVCRGNRQQENRDNEIPFIIEPVETSPAKRTEWARLIQKMGARRTPLQYFPEFIFDYSHLFELICNSIARSASYIEELGYERIKIVIRYYLSCIFLTNHYIISPIHQPFDNVPHFNSYF